MTNHNKLLTNLSRSWSWPIEAHRLTVLAAPRPEVSHRLDGNGRLRIVLAWDHTTIEMFDDVAATLARCILDELEGAGF